MRKNSANSFKILLEVAKNCRHEMWQFLQVLLATTLVLAAIFYLAEADAQPKEYANPLRAFVWALTQFIGDPGDFAGPDPVTTAGRLVASAIGIIHILIFAVPAGMIGSRFSEALEEENKKKEKEAHLGSILGCFQREQCRHTLYKCVPAYISLASLQVKLGLSCEEIIAAIKYSQDYDDTAAKEGLRLRNLADTYAEDAEPQDKLVVELFPLRGATQDDRQMERTEYGCKIDRQSKVTIVAPASYQASEIGDSHFAYYLALYGSFNYVSVEFGEAHSYYISTKKDNTSEALQTDLNALTDHKSDAWVIFIMQVPRELKSQFCFVHNIRDEQQDELEIKTTVREDNEVLFQSTIEKIQLMLRHGGDDGSGGYRLNPSEKITDTPLTADRDESFEGVGKHNIGTLIGAGKTVNAFTIRIASKIIARDRRDIPITAKMAEIFRTSFEPSKTFSMDVQEKMRKAKGTGYTEDTCKDGRV